GRDLRLLLVLDGPFAGPLVDYDLTARSLGFGGTTLEGVSAQGRSARFAGGAVRIPVWLTAARVSGPGKPPPGLTHVDLSGPVTIGRDGGLTVDLAIRSDQAQARLVARGS